MVEQLQIRIHGDAALPTVIYLPGLHGDWTLVPSFRARMGGHVRFVEFTYPRTLEWSLADYARAVDAALAENGITRGWLVAESYGSQVAWALLGLEGRRFTPEALVLAGGFVRHPLDWGVRLARWAGGRVSMRLITWLLFGYECIAPLRHRRAPETALSIPEFIARRTEPDRQAAIHRLDLILAHKPEAIARGTTLPVYALTGFWDPIVPWPPVFRWLRKNCPSLRATRIIGRADHTVLSSAPDESARQVCAWMAAVPANPNREI